VKPQYSTDDFLGDLEPAREQLMLGEGLENDIALESGWDTVGKLFEEQYGLSGKQAGNAGEYLDILEKRIAKEAKTRARYERSLRNLGISLTGTLVGSMAVGKYAETRGGAMTPLEAGVAAGFIASTLYLALRYGLRFKKGQIQRVSSPAFIEALQVFGEDKVTGIVPAIRNAYQGLDLGSYKY
jgi:hypothetical protein